MSLLNFLSTLSSSAFPVGSNGVDPLAPKTGDPMPIQPQAPMAQAPIAQPPVNNAPISIVGKGDDWHPHKRSTLGTIADFALAALGLPIFPFGHANKEKNINDALKGFEGNPAQAIHRLAQIKGEEFNAAKLANQYEDDKRMRGNLDRQNQLFDFQKSKYVFDRAANMMGAVKDEKSWGPMRNQALKIGDAYGVDLSSIIPENFDIDAINTIRAGAVPVAKQMQIDETHDYHEKVSDYRDRNLDERKAYHQGQLRLGGGRLGVSETNAQTGQRNAATSERREAKTAGNVRTTHITKYGPAVVDPDGKHMVLYPNSDTAPSGYDGKGINYINVNGTWVPANTSPKP